MPQKKTRKKPTRAAAATRALNKGAERKRRGFTGFTRTGRFEELNDVKSGASGLGIARARSQRKKRSKS